MTKLIIMTGMRPLISNNTSSRIISSHHLRTLHKELALEASKPFESNRRKPRRTIILRRRRMTYLITRIKICIFTKSTAGFITQTSF